MEDLFCPRCRAPEVNPETGLLFVKGLKVHDEGEWWSHCLRCHCWYSESNKVTLCSSTCKCYSCYPPIAFLDERITWYMHMDTEEIISDEVYSERSREFTNMDDWFELDPRTPVQWVASTK